jgi:predicted bacteriocin transport accessory protein
MAAVLLLGASKAFISATLSDAKIFSSSYTEVGTDNVYKIKTAEETIEMLQKGTGVIFIGFPSCPWCQAYAPMLNDLAREHGITEISYFDIKEDRANDTDNYKDIVSLLSSYLQSDENNNKRVYVPETAFVINGTIIGNDYETSKETLGISDPKEYWTEERVSAWKEQVGKLMDSVKAAEGCTTTCDE